MKIIIEKTLIKEDLEVLNAITHYFSMYPEDNLDDVWDTFKKCNFQNHRLGKGGSHIWINRKYGSYDDRIAIITD